MGMDIVLQLYINQQDTTEGMLLFPAVYIIKERHTP